MKMKLLLSILIALSPNAFAINALKDPLSVEVASIGSTSKSDIVISPGKITPVKFDMSLPTGYHAYFDSFKFEILEPQKGLEVQNFEIKPLIKFYDKFSKKNKKGIKEKSELILNLRAEMSPLKDIQIQMTYQACSEDFCLLPTKKILNVAVIDNPSKSTSLADSLSDISVEDLINQGSILTFLFIFFAGILTSFTPCIFPMIPITLSILGSQTIGKSRWKGFMISLVYVHGIATTYSLLGVAAAKTGTLFGSYLSNPLVVSIIALLFFAMALSMFGLYEIQVPVFIRSKLGNKKISQGYVGAYVTGLIAGIVASPCVGPVLVALLTYVAQSQKAVLGFFLLFTYAMGLGLIFILMGTFSQLISKLPKSGPWMLRVKKVFGVVLIIMGFYYLSPVLKKYFTPPESTQITTPSTGWAAFSEKAIEGARNKQVVVIDFYADWCAACHELDKFTFGNLEVKRELAGAVLLKVDATQENAHVSPILEKYGVVGLPTIIFIEKDGTVRKDLTLTGFESPIDFIKRLNKMNSLKGTP
ncbi:MAG: cytochrome c biogenesis protein CcdA [Bdellovibrionota bacterium]